MRRLTGFLLLIATTAAASQPAPRVGKNNPFGSDAVMAPWLSLSQGPSLIRDPNAGDRLDTTAREDATFVTVYARKKKYDARLGRRVDGDEASGSDSATPWDLPVAPPTHCGNSAYQIIGGQPATGADMMGSLARGC